MEQKVPAVSMDRVSLSPYESHVAQRLQYVVAQVMTSHAGAPEADVARVLAERLRGLGVNPDLREVHQIAESIARMPKS
ncbi:MAG: hypothetical protein JWP76_4314 [Dactylosporangium sp.]|jgi:hypothetical protein|nr:hypothetical protein [Dactylosporangium sp.]